MARAKQVARQSNGSGRAVKPLGQRCRDPPNSRPINEPDEDEDDSDAGSNEEALSDSEADQPPDPNLTPSQLKKLEKEKLRNELEEALLGIMKLEQYSHSDKKPQKQICDHFKLKTTAYDFYYRHPQVLITNLRQRDTAKLNRVKDRLKAAQQQARDYEQENNKLKQEIVELKIQIVSAAPDDTAVDETRQNYESAMSVLGVSEPDTDEHVKTVARMQRTAAKARGNFRQAEAQSHAFYNIATHRDMSPNLHDSEDEDRPPKQEDGVIIKKEPRTTMQTLEYFPDPDETDEETRQINLAIERSLRDQRKRLAAPTTKPSVREGVTKRMRLHENVNDDIDNEDDHIEDGDYERF